MNVLCWNVVKKNLKDKVGTDENEIALQHLPFDPSVDVNFTFERKPIPIYLPSKHKMWSTDCLSCAFCIKI